VAVTGHRWPAGQASGPHREARPVAANWDDPRPYVGRTGKSSTVPQRTPVSRTRTATRCRC